MSGVLAGLLGVGGGLIIVPALLFILPQINVATAIVPQMAVATSLASVIITSVAATYSHHRRSAVRWPVVARMGIGLAVGACSGAWFAAALPGPILRMSYGVFACAVALVLALRAQPAPRADLPGAVGLAGAGIVIGAVSAVVGIGGGTLTVPFLRWRRVAMQHAVATSSACGLPIALGGTLGFILLHEQGGMYTLGYVHWPAALGIGFASVLTVPYGVRLAHRLSSVALTRVFALALALIGLRLLIP